MTQDRTPDRPAPHRADPDVDAAREFDESVVRRVDALFGEGTVDQAAGRRRHRRRRRTALVAGVAAAALVASAVWASYASGASPGSYRTAVVAARDVSQQLTGVATIEPVAQAAVAFPVSGTVATVDVSIGDAVTVGQQLATLDTESLTQALHEKESALAQAELNLSKAVAGEDVGSSGDGAPGGGSATNASATTSTTGTGYVLTSATQDTPSAGSGSGSTDLTAARRAVADAQAAVDDALTASAAAMQAATTVCGAVDGAAAGTTTTTSSTTVPAASSDPLSACTTAIAEVQTAQQEVSDAQNRLASASSALDAQLSALADAAAGGSSGTSGPDGSDPSTGESGGAVSGVGSSDPSASGTSTGTVSSEDLVAAQKAVDAAELEVAVAQQAIAQATIVSPIAGTVVAVGIDVGDSASADSSTQSVIVQGDAGYEVVTTIGVDRITDVAIGQPAVVLPDGADAPIDGKVVAISSTPDPSASTTSYRVTVGLTDPDVELGNGSTGTVTITTDAATSALAVPTSAVTTDGDRSTVTVVDGSTTEDVTVQVGAVGERWTQITSGVAEGQRVVLADLDEALPSAATSSSSTDSTGSGPTGDRVLLPAGGQGGPPSFGGGRS